MMLVKAPGINLAISIWPVRLALVLLAVSAAGCGFELQGAGTLPGGMARTFVATERNNTEFAESLRNVLRQRGSTLLDSPDETGAILSISEDDTGERVLSVTARNTPREYEIWYAITVALEVDDRTLLEAESMVVTRSYTYDETQVLGKAREADELRRALADDLARQVMRRIEAAAAFPAAPL